MQISSRNITLDILKVIAALLIIALHCGFLFEYSKLVNYITCNGLFRIPVPFFFSINGFFLYTIFNDGKIKFWIKRVGLLYLIWMFLFIYFWSPIVCSNPVKIITMFLFGFNHLWYLAALFLGGIFLYRLRKVSNISMIIIIISLYLTGYTIQTLSNFSVFREGSIMNKLVNFHPLHRNFLFFSLPFLSVGYLINRTKYHKRISKRCVVILLFIGLILLVTETLVNYIYSNTTLNMSLSFLLLGPTLLIFAFTFKIHSKFNSKILSSYSIALYLSHPFVIFFLLNFFKIDPTALTLATIILSFIASYFLILLNKKLRYLL